MNRSLCIIISLCLLYSCSSPTYRRASGGTWGTTYHITYKSERDLTDSIVLVMHDVDLSLSPFERQSILSAINRGEHVLVDSMLSEVFELSQRVNIWSGGVFDPTVAPIINLWGFGYGESIEDCPEQAKIDSALCSVGIQDCMIDVDGYMIRKSDGTQFNFSAIAKGYGVDKIAQMLRRNGCNDYLVEVGGEMALSGLNQSGQPWLIQIDAPVIDPEGEISHHPLKVMQVTDICIATSGNYRNHRTTSIGRVGHTISPINGYPISTNTLSATVFADNSALADALATAIMAMPDSLAVDMIKHLPKVSALIVTEGQDGGLIITEVNGE